MTAARKLPETASKPRSKMFGLIRQQLEKADIEADREVAEKYGDDFESELRDLEAGTHPFQRRAPTR